MTNLRTSPPAMEPLTLRSIATRAKLVAVAERLFAERGIENVTLIEINRSAGQRNRNACRYHFGDRNGLLQAILDKHVPGVAERRNTMLDALDARGGGTLAEVVKAFVHPIAAKLTDPDGGKEFIQINAQLIVAQTLSYRNPGATPLALQNTERLARALDAAMAPYGFPPAVLQQRQLLAAMLIAHGLADHARLREAGAPHRAVSDSGIFVSDLEDAVQGLLAAPVSGVTAALLAKLNGRE